MSFLASFGAVGFEIHAMSILGGWRAWAGGCDSFGAGDGEIDAASPAESCGDVQEDSRDAAART